MDATVELVYTPTRTINLSNTGNDFTFLSTAVPQVGDTLFIRFVETAAAWDLYYELTAADLLLYPQALGGKIVNSGIIAAYGLSGTYDIPTKTITIVPAAGRSISQISILPGGTTKKLTIINGSVSLPTLINSSPDPIIYSAPIYIADGFSYNVSNTSFTVTDTDQPESTFYIKAKFTVFNSQGHTNDINVRVLKNGTPVFTYTQTIPVGITNTNVIFETPVLSGSAGDVFSLDTLCSTGTLTMITNTGTAYYEIWGRYEGSTQPGLKTNTKVKVGVVYYDEVLRSTGVIPLEEINIPPFFLRGGSTVSEEFNEAPPILGFIPHLKCSIKNLAPDFAIKYQFLISVVEYSYQQVLAKTYTVNANGSVAFEIDDLRGFDLTDKCRVRLVGVNISGSNVGIREEYLMTNDIFGQIYWDVPILEFDLSPLTITLPANSVYPFPQMDRILVLEVYDPTTISQNKLYYEIGEEYDILVSNGIHYHAGGDQNQDPLNPVTTPAITTIKKGNTWYRYRNAGITINDPLTVTDIIPPYFIESDSITDSKLSNFWDKGRVNIETPNQQRQKYGPLRRWSGILFPNTQVNNLSTWDEGNYNNDLSQRYGDITGLREIGYTLTNLQWMNISKTLLGRSEQTNADASTFLVLSDHLLGTTNPSEDELGTKQPGSICVSGRYLYFIDTIKGKVIRNAPNGNFPISDYFKRKYWRDQSALIESSSNYEVITGFDYKFKDYWVTIRNIALTPDFQETIYFNEDQNAWKYNVDMKDASGNIIDWYGWVGQLFFAMMHEKIWQANTLVDVDGNSVYLKLFGDNKSLVVETIGMIEPDKVKIMLTSTIHANIKPTKVELFIPPNDMYPNGMYSYLMPGNYKYKEGVFYADLKRDWFTKGVPINDAAGRLQIAEGRALRGHVVNVRITYTTNEYVNLFSTSIGMIPSEKS